MFPCAPHCGRSDLSFVVMFPDELPVEKVDIHLRVAIGRISIVSMRWDQYIHHAHPGSHIGPSPDMHSEVGGGEGKMLKKGNNKSAKGNDRDLSARCNQQSWTRM